MASSHWHISEIVVRKRKAPHDHVVAITGYSPDTERTKDMAKTITINQHVVEALDCPPSGSRVYGFGGATARGYEAPTGFGVRVTANGTRAFVLSYTLAGKERRYTIGQYPGDYSSPLEAIKKAK